jgi:hypothetical protein
MEKAKHFAQILSVQFELKRAVSSVTPKCTPTLLLLNVKLKSRSDDIWNNRE